MTPFETAQNIYQLIENGHNIKEISKIYNGDISEMTVYRLSRSWKMSNKNPELAYIIPPQGSPETINKIIRNWNSENPDRQVPPIPKKNKTKIMEPEKLEPEKKCSNNDSYKIPEPLYRSNNSPIKIKDNDYCPIPKKDSLKYNDNVVRHYVPDYRREIKPEEISQEYEYAGIKFSIDKKNHTLKFLNLAKHLRMESPDGFDDEDREFTIMDIQDAVNVGEAIVGIGKFFESEMGK